MKITDQRWCGDEGSQGATCVHTLSTATEDIPEPQWDDVRFGWICGPPENLADIKSWLEQLCSISKDCDVQQLKKTLDRVSTLQRQTPH